MKQSIFLAEVSQLFEPQRRLLRRVLMSLFSIAGLSWFLLFLPIVAMTPQKHELFKANQYQLYLLLLTLWGYDFRRHSKRLEWIIELATSLGKPINTVTCTDINEKGGIALFEIFSKHTQSTAQYFHIIFTWLLLLAALFQISRQMVLLFIF